MNDKLRKFREKQVIAAGKKVRQLEIERTIAATGGYDGLVELLDRRIERTEKRRQRFLNKLAQEAN